MSKKRAFVRYTKSGEIVPGSLIITTNGGYPDKSSLWQEVIADKCCGDICPPATPFCTENWQFENFDGTTFRNGDPIPEVNDNVLWAALTTPAWRYYNDDPANGRIYGKLYNFYAVNDPRGLAPVGWKVPSLQDWEQLAECLGGAEIAGGKLKTTGIISNGTGLWNTLNVGATNEVGFSALPGGGISDTGPSVSIGIIGGFWTSSVQAGFGVVATVYNELSLLNLGGAVHPKFGRSIRLIKDI